jgi:hypothetical protein
MVRQTADEFASRMTAQGLANFHEIVDIAVAAPHGPGMVCVIVVGKEESRARWFTIGGALEFAATMGVDRDMGWEEAFRIDPPAQLAHAIVVWPNGDVARSLLKDVVPCMSAGGLA